MEQPLKPIQKQISPNLPVIKSKGKKKGKFILGGILLLIILIGVSFVIVQGQNKEKASQTSLLQTQSEEEKENKFISPTTEVKEGNFCSTEFGRIETSRQTADGAFSSAVTNDSAIRVISPGKLVGDARFTYLWIKNNQTIPIYAPADGTLAQIFYKTRSDLSADLAKPDYDLVFYVDCHTFYRINHITDPTEEISSQKPISNPLELKPGSGFDNKDAKPKKNIKVSAGQQIGTTNGTPGAKNFDFGVFVDGNAVCPYEKFAEPIRSTFLALLGNMSTPIKGTTCSVNGKY